MWESLRSIEDHVKGVDGKEDEGPRENDHQKEEDTHPRLDPAVVKNRALQSRNQEVCALSRRLSSAPLPLSGRTVGLTPVNRSNMTALKPPGTSYSAESTTAAPSARGTGVSKD